MKDKQAAKSRTRMPAGAFGLLLALAVVAALVLPAAAQAPPGIPQQFWGTVTIEGEPAAEGTQVYAVMNEVTRAIGAVDASGYYGSSVAFMVSGTTAELGSQIEFYIGGDQGTGGVLAGTACIDCGLPDPGDPVVYAQGVVWQVNLALGEEVPTPTPTPEGSPTPTPEGSPTPTPEETPTPGPGTYTLTIGASPVAGGTTTPATGGSYASGLTVNISATANACYQFVSWTGDVASTFSASTTVVMDQNQTVTANFAYICGGGGYFPPPEETPTPAVTPAVTPTAPPPTPTPTETLPPVPTEETIDIPSDGSGVNFTGFGGTVGVVISPGTTAQTAGGDPLTQITLEELLFGYPDAGEGACILPPVYQALPDGATFDPPMTLTMQYDEGQISVFCPGMTEDDLAIAIYKIGTGAWVVLPSTVDTENNVITAEVSDFCYFAVYAQAAAPTPTPAATATPVVPPRTPTPTPEPEEGGGANVGAIVGGIIGALIVIGIIAFLIRRRGQGSPPPPA